MFHFPKYKKLFMNEFILFFELGKLLREKQEKYKARKLHFGIYKKI